MSGHVLVVAGLTREVSCLRGLAGVVPVTGGGAPVALRTRIEAVAAGAGGIVSFGMAGALADGLAIDDWVVGDRLCGALDLACDPAWRDALAATLPDARVGPFYATDRMIDSVAEKLALGARHGALAVDMESHVAGAVAAERGLPFAVARCVSDGARHLLPHAITVSMRADGGVDAGAMLSSLATRPGQFVDFVRTVAGFLQAMRALERGARLIGPRMALPPTPTSRAASAANPRDPPP